MFQDIYCTPLDTYQKYKICKCHLEGDKKYEDKEVMNKKIGGNMWREETSVLNRVVRTSNKGAI
jgi:hypothetical protein